MAETNTTAKALLAVRSLKQRVRALEAEKREPIAVIGVGCRLPGGDTPEQFWDALAAGRDLVREIPDERLIGPWPEGVPRWAGLLDEVREFDPGFFGISPREARSLDPQQRLLLEVAWEGLERAGLIPGALQGSRTGVFVGMCAVDYRERVHACPEPARDAYDTTGNMLSTAAGRIAYTLGLIGPAVTLDTACSSSLTAIHLACQSLRAGHSTLALAGGVNLILSEQASADAARLQALAPDGRCKTFDASADGFVRGEGCALIVLERLSDAVRSGHPILGLIRATAINQDGRSSGLTAPSFTSQAALLRDALDRAGLEPEALGYLECHGTGTSLGDPIEFDAIDAVFGRPRADGSKLWLGAVKTNIGHLEGAAGIAGVVKVLLALEHERLPANLHLRHLNPHIDLDGKPIGLLREPSEWPAIAGRRIAGVSSFGISGTNAHVIVEQAPRTEPIEPVGVDGAVVQPVPVVISGRSEAALARQAAKLCDHVAADPELSLLDLGFSLATARTQFERRACVVASSRAQLLEGLDALASGTPHPACVGGRSEAGAGPVFVFPGQGAQWIGMASALLEQSPAFAATIDACERALAPLVDWSLRAVLGAEDGAPSLERVDVVQPVLFAMMVALAATWRELGVVPAAVVGHSQGEIAAACVAGALSLEQAARIVALRSQVIADRAEGGAMAAVSLAAAELEQRIAAAGLTTSLSVAVDNGPAASVVAGAPEAVSELLALLESEGVFAREIRVTYASHCDRIAALERPLLDALGQLDQRGVPAVPAVPMTPMIPMIPMISMISTVEVGPVRAGQLDASYWYRNLRERVRFGEAIAAAIDRGHRVFVELGPHPVLAVALRGVLDAELGPEAGAVIASLRRDRGDLTQICLGLGELHCKSDQAIDWTACLARLGSPRRVPLPTYAFARERYFIEPGELRDAAVVVDVAGAGLAPVSHALLRAATIVGDGDTRVLSTRVSLRRWPWLRDHRVFDRVVVPGAGFAELALAAAREAWPEAPALAVDELILTAPLLLDDDDDDDGVALQIVLAELDEDGRREIAIYGRPTPGDPAIRHAVGRVGPAPEIPTVTSDAEPPDTWPPAGAEAIDLDAMYDRLAATGLVYGPGFRALRRAWRTPAGELWAEVSLPPEAVEGFALHPALLDATFQLAADARDLDALAASGAATLPFAIQDLQLHGAGASSVRVRACVDPDRDGAASFTAWLPDKTLVARVGALETRPATADRLAELATGPAQAAGRRLHRVVWEPFVGPATPASATTWAIVGDGPDLDAVIASLGRAAVRRYPSFAELLATIDADPSASPEVTVRDFSSAGAGVGTREPAATHAIAAAALAELQAWLARPELERTPLVWITHRAVATQTGEDVPALALAPVWGLLRAVANEAPERVAKLIDLDGSPVPAGLLAELLASGESELALRDGQVLAPRLRPGRPSDDPTPIELAGRLVLVTGGTGQLGAQLCRHLVREHGVRELILTSRRGQNADGAEALAGELAQLGATAVEIAACDVGDREALAALLVDREPGAAFHVAGLLDDAVIANLTPAQLHAVLRPKVDGAFNLHELLPDACPLVMFSSGAGLFGNPGQANYAAANLYLDGLAHHRRAHGRHGLSLAWGLWTEGGMIAHLDATALARLRRAGARPMTVARGMQLLDAALASDQAVLAPSEIDVRALRERAERGELPALLAGLVPGGLARLSSGPTLDPGADIEALLRADARERARMLHTIVAREVATILHLGTPLDPEQPLRELGLDSLMAVEIRNRLQRATGLQLPSTLVFDHPTAQALVELLASRIEPGSSPAASAPIGPRASASDNDDDDGDAIAIVAMACRYPEVDSPEALWRVLDEGRDVIGPLPADRGWDVDNLWDPDPDARGKSIAREGGFVRDAADFDPAFFGMSPREAAVTDPQQRLLLELSWVALERAGIVPRSLRRSATGVYVGVMSHDYGERLLGDLDALDGSVGIGSSGSVASGRIAYTLGLEGPAVTLDTACSSSLVALHLACQALRSGECALALAGGVTIMATPRLFVEFSRQRGMAPDGRCKSFSDDADGAGWSEGAGMLVLERLADAQKNGHPVVAIVRGSAVNQDGRSQGLSAPNGPAQERVIAAALASAGLGADAIDVVEAHGTGTSLGDPIEAGAIHAVYGRAHTADRPLWLGSLKSNLGHTQAAAGVAGVIKMVLAMHAGVLPRTLHAERPSTKIEWDGTVELLREPVAWTTVDGAPRRAAVSSFGVSGTNAHVVLEQVSEQVSEPVSEQVSEPAARATTQQDGRPVPVVISARSEAALRTQAARLLAHLDDLGPGAASLGDLGFSLATARTHFERRAGLVARSRAELIAGLDALAHGRSHPSCVVATASAAASRGRRVFVFPGQGGQWAGMAAALLEQSPAFARSIRACAAALDPHTGFALLDALGGDPALPLDRVDVVQPVLFAMMVSLAATWRELGVVPDAVVGHSQGEIAAACVAGALSLDEAAKVVALRSKLIATTLAADASSGAMLAVALGPDALQAWLEPHGSALALAVDNGPGSTVVSGEAAAVRELARALAEAGVFAREVRVDYASHCPAVEAIRAPLLDALGQLHPRAPTIPMISSVDARAVAGPELDAAYWYRNLRRPVRFAEAVELLLAGGSDHAAFVEVSPHPVLGVALRDMFEAAREPGEVRGIAVGTLHRDEGGLDRALLSLVELHALGGGGPIDWQATFEPLAPRRVALPSYAFERRRHWLDAPAPRGSGRSVGAAGLAAIEHPLLGAMAVVGDGDTRLLSARVSLSAFGWLGDHRVFDRPLLPGAGFVELALAAARATWPAAAAVTLDELLLLAPLPLDEASEPYLQIVLEPEDPSDGGRALRIFGRAGDAPHDRAPTEHAAGRVRPSEAPHSAPAPDPAWPPAGATAIEIEPSYVRLAELGLVYGPAFRGLQRAWRADDGELFAEVELPGAGETGAGEPGFCLHPALLDAALQLALVAQDPDPDPDPDAGVSLPFAIAGLELHAVGSSALRVRARIHEGGVSLDCRDAAGRSVARLRSLEGRRATAEQLRGPGRTSHLHTLAWEPAVVDADAATVAAVVGDDALATRLDAPGFASWAQLLEASVDGSLAIAAGETIVRSWPASAPCDAAAVHRVAEAGLDELRSWLARPELARVRLAWLTRGQSTALDGAALWGLARAARAEAPDRELKLVDLDPDPQLDQPAADELFEALASDEPELAVRGGVLLRARLRTLAPASTELTTEVTTFDPGEAALVTGGTGQLGAALARHLVRTHGLGHVVLCSRRGPEAAGAAELELELRALGAASVEIAACDVADRDALAELIERTVERRPLAAVFHTAGVLDDATLATLTPAQLHRVLRPKLDGALNLHALTRNLELRAFVLFSSAAGLLGSGGQANYAAANACLDALAQQRAAEGLAGLSLAWGLWTQGGMIAHLDDAGLARLRSRGLRPLSIAAGMQLLDAALAGADRHPLVAPIHLDLCALQARHDRGALPAVLTGLVPTGLRRAVATTGDPAARSRLAAVSPADRPRLLLELVRREVARILKLDGEPAPDRPLRELGLDSLMAVELRNVLQRETGLRLASTVAFDHPTPRALATLLARELTERTEPGTSPRSPVIAIADPKDDPIAIVSMACRFPGGVETPAQLWALLAEGRDAIGPFPRDRGWDLDALYDPNPDAVGKSVARAGGFLHDAAAFDPGFFGLSPREAVAVDPQQRLLLELAWESLERAGIVPDSLRASATGVYVGIMYADYGGRFANELDALDGYVGTGSSPSVASGRIAYTLGLEGPAMTVDTACSSSLVTLHLACAALRNRECDLALAGGATVMATPGIFVEFSRLRGMAPDGRCKSFAAAADGAGWAEGAGMLVLERLADARRNGHRVLALVRGSAINQDGRSQGMTAPNGPAQQRVIEAALAAARLSPAQIDAVEGHGTGTALGDPIEAGALQASYGRAHADDRPIWLGSIKSNLGHTQAAAGVAGLIKLSLALERQVWPPTLHVDAPSPHVDWDGTVALTTEARAWPRDPGRPRRGAVSSFGISGTNAHVILEEAPAEPSPSPSPESPTRADVPVPVLISARSEAGLDAQIQRLREHLAGSPELTAIDVAATLATARTHFEHRSFAVADSLEHALEQLGDPVHHTRAGEPEAVRLAFMLTGQGAQRPGMGAQLYARFEPFRAAFDQVCARFDAHLDAPVGLRKLCFSAPGSELAALLDHTAYTQPALFALEVALHRLLGAWGVAPDLLIGHSIGELAAAHLAGVISLDHACELVAARGRLMQALPAGGAMLAIEAPVIEVREALASLGGAVDIAGVNGPVATVVSGDEQPVLALADAFAARGRKTRRLTTSHAFHSRRMQPMLDALAEVAARIDYRPPAIPIVSNLTGAIATPEQLCTPDYWVEHARAPVRFLSGVRAIEAACPASAKTILLELGPHAVLASLAASCVERETSVCLASLRDGRGEVRTLLEGLASLHGHGVAVDWPAYFAPHDPRRVELPTYAFARQRYWLAPPTRERAGFHDDAATADADADGFWTSVERDDLDGLARALALDTGAREALERVLPALATWRRRRREIESTAGWRHAVRWREAGPLPSPSSRASGTGGCSSVVVASVAQADDAIVAAVQRTLGEQTPALLLDVATGAAHDRIAADLAELGPARIVSLLALDERPHPEHPQLPSGLALQLELCRAAATLEHECAVWLATRGAVAATPDDPPPSPAQAMTWGLGRSFALEQPSRWGGLVDLPATDLADADLPDLDRDRLADDQLAVRAGGVLVRRVVAAPPPEPGHTFEPRGAALITGATGALGAHVARWLAGAGIERLILASRRGLAAPGAQALADELEALGARATIVACDVTQREAVAALIAEIDAGDPPLTIVVHAAGVAGSPAAVADLSLAELATTVAPKLAAAWLDELTADRELDAFVCFSSIAATWGSAGQSAYAAGNAFLDALADRRARRGRAATSIAWSLWADAGMGAGDEAIASLGRIGLRPLDPTRAIAALERAIADREVVPTLADVDWSRFCAAYEAALGRGQLLAELRPTAARAAPAPAPDDRPAGLAAQLRALPAARRAERILDLVLEHTAAVLGFDDPGAVEPSATFSSLGLDSVMTVELCARLSTVTGERVPPTLAFDYPTPRHVAALVLEQLGASADRPSLLELDGDGDDDDDDDDDKLVRRLDELEPDAFIAAVGSFLEAAP